MGGIKCKRISGGERCDRCQWQKKGAERVAAVDRCQGASSTQADVGHRNRGGFGGTMCLNRPLRCNRWILPGDCHDSASLAMTYCFNEKEQIPRRASALLHQIQQLFRQRLFLTGNSLRNISSAGNFPIKGGGGSLHVGGQPQIANTQSEDR